ncbi:MAG: AMP-binding protein [Burkholderiaceae bacterium]
MTDVEHAFKLNPELHSFGSVGDMIVGAVERYWARPAFSTETHTYTYSEFGRHVSQAIQFLDDCDLQPGDAVMQLSANRYEMFVLMAACYIGGFVSVTPHYAGSIEDYRYILSDSNARLLICDTERSSAGMQLLAENASALRVFAYDAVNGLGGAWEKINGYSPGRVFARDKPQDIVRLLYTGGTTGLPKGVVTLSSQLAFASLLHYSEQAFNEGTRFLVSSPLTHGAGAFIIPVLAKGGIVVLRERFNAQRTLMEIARGEVTDAFVVPTMLYALLDHPSAQKMSYPNVRRLIYAGAPITRPRLEQALELFGPVLVQNYGQSEVPGTILSLRADEHFDSRADRLVSAGKPYAGVSVTLLDDECQEVARGGGVGEICVRSPHATPGYWKRPDLNKELWRSGWLHTGDLAYQDEDGYFYIVDRKKDMIITGGFNVYPKEIENILHDHPAVNAAAVIGIPHEKWGESVHAVIVLKEGASLDTDALLDLVKSRKGSVMTPKTIEVRESLPLTKFGKIDKKALRASYW